MPVRTLETELFLPRPPEEVFPFFADAANLERITPALLRFRIVSALPIEMGEGTLIDYRLRIRGAPVRWRTRITGWDPPHRFVDEQVRGPYRLWRHTHTFEARDGGTLCRDVVEYRAPLDLLTHRWLVRPDLERIFAFRREALAAIFSEEVEGARIGAGPATS